MRKRFRARGLAGGAGRIAWLAAAGAAVRHRLILTSNVVYKREIHDQDWPASEEVLPHARAEERTLYRAARRYPDASLLVQALIGEHRMLASMAGRRGESADAAAQAVAISALFASHVAREESLLLPALERFGADLPAVIGREPRLAGSQCAA